jgi:hypothetical protein
MKRPTCEKFIYDLHSLPSCLQNYHFPHDARTYHLQYHQIIRRHKKWMRTHTTPHHRYPPTQYPLTSGELSMIQLQNEELKIRHTRKKIQETNHHEDSRGGGESVDSL